MALVYNFYSLLSEALLLSSGAKLGNNVHHRNVAISTYGIVFCGTPRLGGNKAELGEAVTRIASVYYYTNPRLVSFLKSSSEILQEDLANFNNISEQCATIFAYETVPTKLKTVVTLLVSVEWSCAYQ